MKKTDVSSSLTTNEDIAQIALVLWSNADYLSRTLTSANLLAKYRAKLGRMSTRMQREAMSLGDCLDPPNKNAFLSLNATKTIADQVL